MSDRKVNKYAKKAAMEFIARVHDIEIDDGSS